MPLKRSEFAKWEIVEADPNIVAQHQETGAKIELLEDGGINVISG